MPAGLGDIRTQVLMKPFAEVVSAVILPTSEKVDSDTGDPC